MAASEFTAKWVEGLKYGGPSKWIEYRDSNTRGLVLRIFSTGKKTWYLIYRAKGSRMPKRLKLDNYPSMSLAGARQEAKKQLAAIGDGADPVRDIQVMKAVGSVEEVLKAYLELRVKKQRTCRETTRIIENEIIPVWGHYLPALLQRREIRAWAAKKAVEHPVMGNRILAVFKRAFNWAVDEEMMEANPLARLRPVAEEKTRDRVLKREEIQTFWEATEKYKEVLPMSALRLILVTAQRPGEVAFMEWADLDMKGGWWTIPAEKAKNGLSHRVPLNELAKEILESLPKCSRYVFPNREDNNSHVARNTLSQVVRRYRLVEVLGLPPKDEQGNEIPKDDPKDTRRKPNSRKRPRVVLEKVYPWGKETPEFTPHDLRRTAASNMAAAGVSRLVISKILNHVETGITAVYDRHSYDKEKRLAMIAWEERLRRIIKGEVAEVIELRA